MLYNINTNLFSHKFQIRFSATKIICKITKCNCTFSSKHNSKTHLSFIMTIPLKYNLSLIKFVCNFKFVSKWL